METVTLAYAPTVIDACDTDNWVAGPHSGKSNDTTAGLFMVGTGSTKFVVDAALDAEELIGYKVLTSANLSTYSHITFWFRSSIALNAGDVSFGYAADATMATPVVLLNLPAAIAGEWTKAVLTLSGSRGDCDSMGLVMEVNKAAFDFWIDDVRGVTAHTFSVLAIRGLDDPDDVEFYPAITHQFLDGSKGELMLSYCRMVTMTFGVMLTKSERTFLIDWLLSTTKSVIGRNDDMDCVMADPEKHSQSWLADFSSARSVQIGVKEKTARTTKPVSWGY